MRELVRIAWERLKIILAIVGDAQARFIAILFYYTILVPFGLISRVFTDPLHLRPNQESSFWMQREPVPNDLDAAKQQG
ncbi:MAG TPA: hypothetical protein VK880_03300 [Anaerolineales bacterium]|nr:hypothetical protein [Anaerolineales bacterium]